MANVTLKRKMADGSWVEMYPETILEQISDISVVGKNLAELDNPGSNAFIKVAATGVVTLIDAATLKSDLSASDVGHGHAQSDISGLVAALAAKADLVGGKLSSSQIPDYLFSGMRRMADFANVTNDTLEELYALLVGANDTEKQGGYFIASADFSLTFSAPHVVISGDEGDTTSPITIEAGDWIVYAGVDGTDKQWAIINNTYRAASESALGVVQLSNTAAVNRFNLSNTLSSAKVMDESKVRQVIKDIYYGGSPTGLTGDLWFDGTFS